MKSKQEIIFKDLFKIPIKNGLFKPTRVRGSGTKMINMGEIFAIDRIFDVPMELVPLTDIEEKNAIIEKNDLIFARSSLADGAGKCSIFLGNEKTTFESHIIRVRINPKIANSKFYYYYFNSSFGKNSVYSITEKTAASGIRGSDLANLVVPFPNKDTQDNMVNQLENLDTKIENLQNQNRILEQIAQAIFKSWFVDFDGVTEFEDSELGKIPKGWKIKKIDDILQLIYEDIKPELKNNNDKYIALDDIPKKSITLSNYSNASEVNSSIIKFQQNDILFGNMRPYFHKVIVAPFDGITRKTTFVLRPKTQNLHSFSLFYVSSDDMIAHCTSNMIGTSIPYVKWDSFNSYQIIVPLDNILEKFQKIAGPMIETLIQNYHEIKALTKTRDTLLPKLMSGEIRV